MTADDLARRTEALIARRAQRLAERDRLVTQIAQATALREAIDRELDRIEGGLEVLAALRAAADHA